MQSLNHDKGDMNDQHDVDELLRRAAEFNSLNAGTSDWDKVLERLSSSSHKISPVTLLTSGKGVSLFVFQASFITILLFLISFLYNPNNIIRPSIKRGVESPAGQIEDSLLSLMGLRISTKDSHFTTESFFTKKNSLSSSTDSLSGHGKNHLVSVQTLLSKSQTVPEDGFRFSPGISPKISKKLVFLPVSSNSLSVNPTVSRIMPFVKKWVNETSIPQISISSLTWKPAIQTADSIPKINNSKSKQRRTGIYLGVTGGLDLSKVKAQHMNKTGYTTGLIIGYRFDKKISLESGILWNKRKYYSDGKYFNMNKVGATMPSDMKIMTVDGELSSFEIPIKVKYNLGFNKNSNLFVSSGMISNVFLSEENRYLTELNGIQNTETALYKDVTYSVLSVLSVSAGYELLSGRAYSIRFEPYIKIPLKTMGVGSLPVISAGVGITVSNFLGTNNR